jgi:hypothetical protein
MEIWDILSGDSVKQKITIPFRAKKETNDDSEKGENGEKVLQNLIFTNPDLFPVKDCSGESGNWIPLAQEVSLKEGRLDILATDSAANIYILECKLNDNKDGKTIRSQIDNYASGFWNEIETHGIDSFWESLCDKIQRKSEQKLEKILEDQGEDSKEIMNSMKKNLEEHKIILVFVVDRITSNLRTTINWWNTRIDPKHDYPSFALEVNQYGENEELPSTYITQLFPYDHTEIITKGEKKKRERGTIKKWKEQVRKNSELNETDKEKIFEFQEELDILIGKEDDSYLDFGTGQTIRLMPKFSKYVERSPIGIKSNGTLKFQFGLIRFPEGDPSYAIAEKKFREKIIEIESLKHVNKILNAKIHKLPEEPGVGPEIWLPHKKKILEILKEVFITE